MVSKKIWKKEIDEFAETLRLEEHEKKVEVMGHLFRVLPGVFSPALSTDTEWFSEVLCRYTLDRRFLEIGAGTGILSCLALIGGAKEVVATDINPEAVKNICINSELHGLSISARKGSLFSPLKRPEIFDVIFWNHPFYFAEEPPKDMLDASVYDENYNSLRGFFEGGKSFLAPQGFLLLGTSNIARINRIKSLAREFKYAYETLEVTKAPVFKGRQRKMDLRVMKFSPA